MNKLIGVLIVAHGPLGDILIDSLTHVLGVKPEAVEALDVSSSADPAEVRAMIARRIEALDAGNGVLVLTDVFGATPSNCVCRALASGYTAGLTGVNLPMLLKIMTYRTLPLKELAAMAAVGGQEGISVISQEMCDAVSGC